MLLGLLREEEGVAAQVLRHLGVETDEVHDSLTELLGSETARPSVERYPAVTPSPLACEALEYAVEEAAKRGASSIGVEHLIIALARQQRELVDRTARELRRLRDQIEVALQGLQGLLDLEPGGDDTEDGQ